MKRALLFASIALLTLNSCGIAVGGAIGFLTEKNHVKELEKEVLNPLDKQILEPEFKETVTTKDSVAIEIQQFYLPQKKFRPGTYSVGTPLVQTTHLPPMQMPYKEYHYKDGEIIYIKTYGYDISTKGKSIIGMAALGGVIQGFIYFIATLTI